jgi:hypothetical protein
MLSKTPQFKYRIARSNLKFNIQFEYSIAVFSCPNWHLIKISVNEENVSFK